MISFFQCVQKPAEKRDKLHIHTSLCNVTHSYTHVQRQEELWDKKVKSLGKEKGKEKDKGKVSESFMLFC